MRAPASFPAESWWRHAHPSLHIVPGGCACCSYCRPKHVAPPSPRLRRRPAQEYLDNKKAIGEVTAGVVSRLTAYLTALDPASV